MYQTAFNYTVNISEIPTHSNDEMRCIINVVVTPRSNVEGSINGNKSEPMIVDISQCHQDDQPPVPNTMISPNNGEQKTCIINDYYYIFLLIIIIISTSQTIIL